MLKLILKTLALVLASFAGIALLVYINSESLTEKFIKKALKEKGITELHFKIKTLSIHRIIVENLSWNKYCLSVQKIDCAFSLYGVFHQRYGKLLLEDVNSCYEQNKFKNGQKNLSEKLILPLLVPPQIFPYIKNINFQKIEIKNLNNKFDSQDFHVESSSHLEFLSRGDIKEIKIDTSIMQNETSAHIVLEGIFSPNEEKIKVADLSLKLSKNISLKAKNITYYLFNDSKMSLAFYIEQLFFNDYLFHSIQIRNGIVNPRNNHHQGKIEVKHVENKKLGFKNLNLAATYLLQNDQLSSRIKLFPSSNLFLLHVDGSYNFNKNSGKLALSLPRLLVKDKNEIKAFMPNKLSMLKSLEINLNIKGNILIKNKIIRPNLILNLKNAAFGYNDIDVKKVCGGLSLTNFFPLIASGNLLIPSIEKPVPIQNIKGTFALYGNKLTINTLGLSLWNGDFHLAQTEFNIKTKTLSPTTLKFSNLDLKQIFVFLNKPNLEGSGTLGGLLPLTFIDYIPLINEGNIFSETKGNLKIKLQQSTKQAVVRNQHVNILTDFLENLDYQHINLHLSTNQKLDIKSQLEISGNNPALKDKYQNRPLEFKMTLNFNIVKMLKSQGASIELPEKIEKLFLKNGY